MLDRIDLAQYRGASLFCTIDLHVTLCCVRIATVAREYRLYARATVAMRTQHRVTCKSMVHNSDIVTVKTLTIQRFSSAAGGHYWKTYAMMVSGLNFIDPK